MVKAGVLPSDQSVRQFVIVAKDDEAVRLFVEFYGDERMLQVATTLEGITIDSVPAPPDTEEVTP
jgi:hypothetical protein